ncbi:prepilin peptidase [Enterobacteriaceae bacterium LUAb1]
MNYELLLWLLYSLIALCIGSFLNVVIYRLPRMILTPQTGFTLCQPRSHCPHCKTVLRIIDNIPLCSWLYLRGRCRWCKNRISWCYPAIECITLVLSLSLSIWLPFNTVLAATLLFSGFLLTLAIIDVRHQLLPDRLTLPLLWLGLLFQALQLLPYSAPAEGIIGAICGYSLFWLLAESYQRLKGVNALGRGDAKLLAALGAWLGWQLLPQLLLFASGIGLLIILIRHLRWQCPLRQPLPFGPCLAGAGWILYLWQLT